MDNQSQRITDAINIPYLLSFADDVLGSWSIESRLEMNNVTLKSHDTHSYYVTSGTLH